MKQENPEDSENIILLPWEARDLTFWLSRNSLWVGIHLRNMRY